MNLALTDDQRMIRDSAAEFLAEASESAAVRKAMASPAGYDPQLWSRIGELGWCGTAIPEASGGLGLGAYELVLIAEQAGRRLLCSPFLATVCLAGNLLTQAGTAAARKKYLPRIADGSLAATAVFDGTIKARGGRLTGEARVVDAGAQLLLFCAGGAVHAVERGAAGLRIALEQGWDATRRFARVTLKNVTAERVGAGPGIARAEARAQLFLAAEQLGGAQQCQDLILRYTMERRQFGRSIASFQAVKHRCALLMVKVESLRSLVYGAAVSGDAQECAAAKALANDTFFDAAAEAIQLHGGVGFTSEFDPQLYFKRAQAMSHWLGRSDALREQITQQLVA